jgi:hypothetical protein
MTCEVRFRAVLVLSGSFASACGGLSGTGSPKDSGGISGAGGKTGESVAGRAAGGSGGDANDTGGQGSYERGGSAPGGGGSGASDSGGYGGAAAAGCRPPATQLEPEIWASLSTPDSTIQAASGAALVELAQGLGFARGYALCRCLGPPDQPADPEQLANCAREEAGVLKLSPGKDAARCIVEDMATVPGLEDYLRCASVKARDTAQRWLELCGTGGPLNGCQPPYPSESGCELAEPEAFSALTFKCNQVFYCQDGARAYGKACDGHPDCDDLSDEAGCRCDAAIGVDHPDAAQSYTIARDVVNDHSTGLMWEKMPTAVDAGLFQEGLCSTRSTGGFNGWRRPTLRELVSIVDYGARNPAMDVAAFPDMRVGVFATATPVYQHGRRIGSDGYGWSVESTTGLWMNGLPPSFLFRCVRVEVLHYCYRATERYRPTSSSAVEGVYDASSGLTWQRHAAPETKNWTDAASYCEGLGDGYRLPGVKELLSIVDFEIASQPAIDTSAFPDTPTGVFWSATRAFGEASKVLATNFMSSDRAYAQAFDENTQQYVRCVR